MRVANGHGEISDWLLKLGNGAVEQNLVEKIFGAVISPDDFNEFKVKSMEVPTKKFYNNADSCIEECLTGVVKKYPQLQLHTFQRIIIDTKLSGSDTVGLISGGGSGHEPFSAGYVGTGMLTASVSGDVFASPPPTNILKAIREVSKFKPKGILLIILNYTGDCLNFGIASYRAAFENIKVDTFICEDDFAHVNEDLYQKQAQKELTETTITGRRGVAGALFILKIAGALAQQGKSLKEIIDNLNQLSKNIGTLGVCFDACSLPGQPKMFNLNPEEIEIGIGIHGEAGAARKKYGSVQTIIHGILNKISKILNLQRGDVIALIINNLGGTSKLEENIVVSEVVLQFEKNNITVARVYSGHLMTCLEMAGIQVSVLCLEESNRALWLQCLDAPTDAPAWPGKSYSVPSDVPNIIKILSAVSTVKGKTIIQLTEYGNEMLKECLSAAANAIIAKEKYLNTLDRIGGDGDCGSTLRRLAEAILIQLLPESCDDPIAMFFKLESLAEKEMGGTSGAIYSLFFRGIAEGLESPETNFAKLWGIAVESGVKLLMKYSNARVGDRTMLDALIPAKIALTEKIMENPEEVDVALDAALKAATDGYLSTIKMRARAGRASYVNRELLKNPDPGAYAVFVWVEAIVTSVKLYINLIQ